LRGTEAVSVEREVRFYVCVRERDSLQVTTFDINDGISKNNKKKIFANGFYKRAGMCEL